MNRLALCFSSLLCFALPTFSTRISPLSISTAPQVSEIRNGNDRPIIGILSQPGAPAPEGQSYIAASYVKWVESAGARAVPIFYDMTREEIANRFRVLNGVLLPGGGATLKPGHPFYDAANQLVELAIEANENGDYFPVHGTCLGFETLSIIISKNYTILSKFDAEDAAAPLLYTDLADSSHLLTSLPRRVVRNLQDHAIAMENHVNGLSMQAFEEDKALHSFFRVISLSLDKQGVAYVSTMESWKYPITATQWHPEKNAFEWTPALHIPHTPQAIEMAQQLANFFISEARRNSHIATDMEVDNLLIYNWAPTFTGKQAYPGEEADFEQAYFFKHGSGHKQSDISAARTEH